MPTQEACKVSLQPTLLFPSFFFQWLEEGSYISLTWKLTDRKLVITFNLFMKKSLMSDSERQKLISKSCDVTLKAACKEIHA